MKPYDELTHTGRMRRMGMLARKVACEYGLHGARVSLLRHAGNTLFRVVESDPDTSSNDRDLFRPGHYLLRIHQAGYQASDTIRLELEWLRAMRRDADLPVPEPVEDVDGRLLKSVEIPEIPGPRQCSLLRWVKGRLITKNIQPRHFRSQGALMARMHDFASGWQTPDGLTKRKYDWNGLFHDDSGAGIPASEVWSTLPESYYRPFDAIARRVRKVMDKLGQGPDVYGLIHADFGVDANVLFHRGEARGIDFDDSGFGYYIYDLAISLEHVKDHPNYMQYQDALIQGYRENRELHDDQLAHFELFMMGFHVYWCLWAFALLKQRPNSSEWLQKRLDRSVRLIKQFTGKFQYPCRRPAP